MLAALVPLLFSCEKERPVPKDNTHAIEVVAPDHGEIAILGSLEKAAEGYEVTFSVKPGECYVVDQVRVTSASGAVSTTMKDNTYQFVMPGAPVKISASFKLDTPGVVTFDAGEFTVKNGETVVSSGASVELLQKLTIEPAAGQAIASVKANGKAVAPNAEGKYIVEVKGGVKLEVKTAKIEKFTLKFVDKYNGGDVATTKVTFDGTEVTSPFSVKAGVETTHQVTVSAEGFVDFNEAVKFPAAAGEVKIELIKELELEFKFEDFDDAKLIYISSLKLNGENVEAPYKYACPQNDTLEVEVLAADYGPFADELVITAAGEQTIKLDKAITLKFEGVAVEATVHRPRHVKNKPVAVTLKAVEGMTVKRDDTIYVVAKEVKAEANGTELNFDSKGVAKYVVTGKEKDRSLTIEVKRLIPVKYKKDDALFTVTKKDGTALAPDAKVVKGDVIVVKSKGAKIVVKVNGTDVAEENNEFTYTVKGDEKELKIEVAEKPAAPTEIVVKYTENAALFTVVKKDGAELKPEAKVVKDDVIVVKPAAGKTIEVKVNGGAPLTADSEGNFSYKVTGTEAEVKIEVVEK